ncbi:MAG: TetR/AcrR family transcriptional regulator [Bacteroidota bacterium]
MDSVSIRIIESAEEMFFRYGIKSITMDDIAKQLGMSKKTIYQHFSDKDKLVESLIREHITRNTSKMCHFKASAKNAIEEVLYTMKHLGEMFSKINPTMFYDLFKYHHESWKIYKDFKDKYIASIVEANLARGIQEKLYRSDIHIKVLAKLRIEQVEMGFNQDIFPSDQFSLVEVQIEMLKHFLLGISSIKGHKLVNAHMNILEHDN